MSLRKTISNIGIKEITARIKQGIETTKDCGQNAFKMVKAMAVPNSKMVERNRASLVIDMRRNHFLVQDGSIGLGQDSFSMLRVQMGDAHRPLQNRCIMSTPNSREGLGGVRPRFVWR